MYKSNYLEIIYLFCILSISCSTPKVNNNSSLDINKNNNTEFVAEINLLSQKLDSLHIANINNIVTVEFTKVNGDYRKMKCTLQSNYLPETTNHDVVNNQNDKPNLSVWDIDANGWRSFKWDNLMGYSLEKA